MTEELGGLERRIDGVQAVGSVVRAMLALARAQLPEADAAAAEATTYVDQLDAIIERLAGPLESRSPASTLVVVLGPERPLCGALPRRLARAAREVSGRLVLVGRRFAEAYEAVPGGPEPERVLGGPSSAGELDEASRRLAAAILEADAEEVELRHPIPGGAVHRSVLLGGVRAARRDPPETFSPVDVVLADAVREATTARLRVALAEALRVELAARLTAAQAARRAVEDKEEELRSAWRVARHERITTEILELQRFD